MKFEWDEIKNRANRRKHGVSFETASLVFADPFARMLQDRVVDGEPRWQAIGRVADELVLVVAHTVRNRNDEEIIRIISARRALKQERKRYEEQSHG